MGQAAKDRMQARMRRVVNYIEQHLEDELSLQTLSRVAALSPHHFHRRFTSAFGVGVHRYVQLLRLRRAGYRLAFRKGTPVTMLALDAGYEAPEAFARAFRQRMGQTPSGFRSAPDWAAWHAGLQPLGIARENGMTQQLLPGEVRVLDFPETPVGILEHRGDPAGLGDTLRRFIAWRRAARLPPSVSATFNILHDDPATTPPERFRLGLCAATPRVPPNDAGVVAGVIPGGRCAALRHVGTEASLAAAIAWLYREWLPASGERLREAPLFCQRLSLFPDVPEHEAETEILLPLR